MIYVQGGIKVGHHYLVQGVKVGHHYLVQGVMTAVAQHFGQHATGIVEARHVLLVLVMMAL